MRHVPRTLILRITTVLKNGSKKHILQIAQDRQTIKEISQKPQVDDLFIMQDYGEFKQWEFGVDVITRFGYDWQNGRQDKAAHPFTTTFGYGR